jgi:predicted AlkP superfamily phosphohydrolase/phosphomutase
VWQSREADFLMLVEIGPDRLHHGFFEHLSETHPRHRPESPEIALARAYYAALDEELGALCALADTDTAILVASDHGARPLRSAFCISEWLIREGLLTLRERPLQAAPLRAEWVDWERSQVWAEGGYYARVFVNLRGREPRGAVAPEAYEALRRELRARLLAITAADGSPWRNRVEAPDELYRQVAGQAPDLIAIFDDLDVRALATVGSASLHQPSDDRRADSCNHDWYGIFVLAGAGVTARGELAPCEIQDVGASALALLGVAQPPDWLGVDRSGLS